MTSRRLFIGLMASPNTQREVLAYQIRWDWPAAARLNSPEKLHLTLLFLGNVEEADEVRLRAALARVPMDPLYLELSEPEVFTGGVVTLRTVENRALELLQSDIAAVVRDMGLKPHANPWKPHVTLARNAEGCLPPKDSPAIELDALKFSLVCSRPERANSYEVIESWPAG